MLVFMIVLLTAFAYYLSPHIRKYFPIITIIVGIYSYIALFQFNTLTLPLISGEVGLGFFVVVMFTGALKRGTSLNKRLRSVRKEYSILGFILLLPHAVLYLIDFIDGSYPWEWFGVVAFIIMIPLFITSFQSIKKKMGIKRWMKTQKFAYLVYLLIFVHLIVVAETEHQVLYGVIFAVYTVLKLKNYVLRDRVWLRRLAISSVVVITVIASAKVIRAEDSDSSLFTYSYTDDSSTTTSSTSISTSGTGTYTGTATGFRGLTVEVDVTFVNGEITDIEIIDCGCTEPHHGTDYEAAADRIVALVLSTQSTDIDSISGATTTSHGILNAIEDAIDQMNEDS